MFIMSTQATVTSRYGKNDLQNSVDRWCKDEGIYGQLRALLVCFYKKNFARVLFKAFNLTDERK